MTDLEFIELSIRYLDGADLAELDVDRLSAEMLDRPERRALYRDLVQQSQLTHEWHSTATPGRPARPRRKVAPILVFAAAAAVVLAATFLKHSLSPAPQDSEPIQATESRTAPYFDDRIPSWSDIYLSPFDYPDFVWRAEISADDSDTEPLDEFSGSGLPPLIAATPGAEFHRLLAPIALLPSDGDLERWPE